MIRLEQLSIRLPGFSMEDVSFQVEEGEFFALIGPTGSGKTLILESIAGLVKPSSGRIWLGGREATGQSPEKRGVGIVYQDHALFPHLSVRKNITYGLRYLAADPAAGEANSLRLCQKLGITHLLDRGVTNLSGGEKQRVSLARALAVEPKVLLLDEPLSALDPNFRDEIRGMLAELHRETGLTCLMVSHDFGEVRSLAQRAAVIHQGRLEQVGLVEEIFQRPGSSFVAGFVGLKNLFPAELAQGEARLGHLRLKLNGQYRPGRGHVCIRPEKVRRLAPEAAGGERANIFKAQVKSCLDMGAYWDTELEADGLRLHCALPKVPEDRDGLKLNGGRFQIRPEDIHFISD